MRLRTLAVLAVMVAMLVACRGREQSSMTGSYGNAVISGQAFMAAGSDNVSPAGVQVTVSGTGMTTTLGADGRFTFVGVPENAELHFSRASDSVDLRLAIAASNSNALRVQLQSKNGGHHRASGSEPMQQVEGTVVTSSATSITIHDSHGNDVTLAITPKTLVRKGRTNVDPATLAAGTRVHAKALVVDKTDTAIEIIVQDDGSSEDNGGQTMTANGPVTAVGASSLTVNSEDHGSVTVNVDANTIIRKLGTTIHLSDIKVGDQVNTMGTRVDDHTLLARQIEVRGVGQNETMEAEGSVSAVGASSLTVSTRNGSITVNTDSNTVIRKQGSTIHLSDVKVGDEVEAIGTRVDATTLLARQIDVKGEGHG